MTTVTSIRLPDDLVDRLDRIAESLDRSRGWVIRQALARYVQEQETPVSAVKSAIDELEASTPLSSAHQKVIAALELMIEQASEQEP